jgi:hypothetical protein
LVNVTTELFRPRTSKALLNLMILSWFFFALKENKFPDLRLSDTTLLHVQRSFLHRSVLLQFKFQLVSGVHKHSRIFGSCIILIQSYRGRKHDITLSWCYAHSIHSANI